MYQLLREPIHVVFGRSQLFLISPKFVNFYKITRGTRSVRETPVQYGDPVHAVMVQYIYLPSPPPSPAEEGPQMCVFLTKIKGYTPKI